MPTHKLAIKLFAKPTDLHTEAVVPVFHRWIQTQAVENHLLIDVSSYTHVPDGPGVVLVSSEANFYLDETNRRLGVLYQRKLATPGSFADRLRAAIHETLKAAVRLEEAPEFGGKLTFETNEISIRLNDRLLAPNTAETFNAVKADIEAVVTDLYAGQHSTISHTPSDLALFEVIVKVAQSPSIATLLDRLGSARIS
jgi:hypothetical protein